MTVGMLSLEAARHSQRCQSSHRYRAVLACQCAGPRGAACAHADGDDLQGFPVAALHRCACPEHGGRVRVRARLSHGQRGEAAAADGVAPVA